MLVARHLKASINVEIRRRVENRIAAYLAFWESPCTPDQILEQFGTDARTFIRCSREDLASLSQIALQVGKTLSDFIPDEYLIPRREFVEHDDGTVTLAPPAAGYDAWGRLISE